MGYMFDPQKLKEIGEKAAGLPHERMMEAVVEEAAAAYPGHIETRMQWVFSLAGGITGIMNVMHGSMTEYLLIFGTPTGTDGFSGRYCLDIYDVMLSGEMKTYEEGSALEPAVFRPGDMALLERGRVKGVSFSENCWMLEYGRGFIVSSLPYALVTSLDPPIICKTLRVYGRLALRELLRGKL
jgi:hypothetical protein